MGDDPGSADAYLLLLPNEPIIYPTPDLPPLSVTTQPTTAELDSTKAATAGDHFTIVKPPPWEQARSNEAPAAENKPRVAAETKSNFDFWWEKDIDPILHSLQEFFR